MKKNTKAIYQFTHIPTGNVFWGTTTDCKKEWGYSTHFWEKARASGEIDMTYMYSTDEEVNEVKKGKKYWHLKALLEIGI